MNDIDYKNIKRKLDMQEPAAISKLMIYEIIFSSDFCMNQDLSDKEIYRLIELIYTYSQSKEEPLNIVSLSYAVIDLLARYGLWYILSSLEKSDLHFIAELDKAYEEELR